MKRMTLIVLSMIEYFRATFTRNSGGGGVT